MIAGAVRCRVFNRFPPPPGEFGAVASRAKAVDQWKAKTGGAAAAAMTGSRDLPVFHAHECAGEDFGHWNLSCESITTQRFIVICIAKRFSLFFFPFLHSFETSLSLQTSGNRRKPAVPITTRPWDGDDSVDLRCCNVRDVLHNTLYRCMTIRVTAARPRSGRRIRICYIDR